MPRDNGPCVAPRNWHDPMAAVRALLVALGRVGGLGQAPPDSRLPRIDDGTLVPADQRNVSGNARRHVARGGRTTPRHCPTGRTRSSCPVLWCAGAAGGRGRQRTRAASAFPISQSHWAHLPAGTFMPIPIQPASWLIATARSSRSPQPRRTGNAAVIRGRSVAERYPDGTRAQRHRVIEALLAGPAAATGGRDVVAIPASYRTETKPSTPGAGRRPVIATGTAAA